MANDNYKTVVRYGGDDMFVAIPPSGNALLMDANSERKAAPTPLENLLVAVGGCTAFDVQSILKKKRQDVTDYYVEVAGERREEYPRKFIKMHVKHVVHGRNISEKAVADAIKLSDETYCTVAATVRPTVELTTSYEIVEVGESSEATA